MCPNVHYDARGRVTARPTVQPARRQGRGTPCQPLRWSVTATMAAVSQARSVTATGPKRKVFTSSAARLALYLFTFVIGGAVNLDGNPVLGIPVVLEVRVPVELPPCLMLGRGQPVGAF